VVACFDIACGECFYCRRGLFTACDTTNPSKEQEQLYGHRTAGLFGYAHMTGGWQGGQAELVRVPLGARQPEDGKQSTLLACGPSLSVWPLLR
jgi:threonine dehydrogenase-like Zn-dependent dehydrogenase